MKKNINLFITLFGLLIVMLNQSAWADRLYADVITKISQQRYSMVKYEEKYNAFYLDEALKSRGEMRFEPPDKLTKTVLEPEPLIQEIEGDTVVVTWGNGKIERFSLEQHRGLESMANTLRSILSGNIDYIEKNYEVEFSGTKEHWNMVLMPKDVNVKKWIKNITLLGANGKINQFTVTEVNGDYSTTTLYE